MPGKAAEIKKKRNPRKYYETLIKLVGMGSKGVTDASTTIDELLYGQDYLKEMLSMKNAEVVITLEEVSKS